MADPFDRVLGQPRVREFLRRAVAGGRVGQAYLFAGPVGSNKTQAAYALAQCLVCPKGGCGTCEACKRVMRHRHPDVKLYEPEGANGYLVGQMRELIEDTALAPVDAPRKVYIVDEADKLGVQAANAFLKTLEEPPADVVFVLLGRTADSVLPTIASRCQVVPFRHIPADEAAGIVSQNSGADALHARVAIQACGGSITHAIEFCMSSERFVFRDKVLSVMRELPGYDDVALLDAAGELVEQAKAPLDLVREAQDAELASSADYLARAQVRQMEMRNKRALTKRTREALAQLTAIVRSWLRDVLVVAAGAPQLVVNADVAADVERAAQAAGGVAAVVRAIGAPDEADRAIAYNVSPETSVDALLVQIREDLYGSHNPSHA